MNSNQIVVYGEVLYDCFPDGRRVLGGAPFNVAWSLQGLGKDPLFVSAVGMDADGRGVENRMTDWGMSSQGLQRDPLHETGEVRVTIEDNEPSYEICEDRAWDYIQDQEQRSAGVLYHGLLALRNSVSRATLKSIQERSPEAIRFFDINLRPPYTDRDLLESLLYGVNWLKLNVDELRFLMEEKEVPFDHAEGLLDRLMSRYNIDNVVLTGGARGAILRGAYGQAACMPAPEPDEFIDTVGAGDAFTAYTINGLVDKQPAADLVTGASHFAATVCGLRGATTTEENFYKIKHA